MGSTYVLLNSKSNRFPNGFGNDSRRAWSQHHGPPPRCWCFRSVSTVSKTNITRVVARSLYIPRFRNIGNDKRNYLRGFGYQGGASRQNWSRMIAEMAIGADLKDEVTTPGKWSIGLTGFGEILPYTTTCCDQQRSERQAWFAHASVDTELKDNEMKIAYRYGQRCCRNARSFRPQEREALRSRKTTRRWSRYPPKWNGPAWVKIPRPRYSTSGTRYMLHRNVFVTDGSFMASAACVNPSLTYMAFTARAVNHAVEEIKKQNIV